MDRRMLDYLPEIMKNVGEFVQIADAEQMVKEKLWKDAYRMLDEAFISTMSANGIKRWERTLNLTPKDTDGIESRRVKVMGRLLSDIPYTVRTFKKTLDGLCGEGGYKLSIDFDNNIVDLTLCLNAAQIINELVELAEAVIPAHIIINVTISYNTHRILSNSGFTHRQLRQYTHAQIKNTILVQD
jgi:hypothetical protein